MQKVLRRNQTGIVSILVTMILMVVIILIVIGFSQVSRRNQREALDQQLSTQAYYAAETGINDAYKLLSNGTAVTNLQGLNASCDRFINDNTGHINSTLNAGAGTLTSYTCLLVDDTPSSLLFDNLLPGKQTVIPLTCISGGASCNFASFNFTWAPKVGSSGLGTCPVAGTFSPNDATHWQQCHYGILRVDLVPTSPPNPVTAAGLIADTKTFYIVPTGNGATVITPTNASAVTLARSGGCSTACSATLNVNSASQFYARVTLLYTDTARLTVTATKTGGLPANFSGGQAVIDSTGKAQDELKRIQVRVPLVQANNVPINALQTTNSICKRFSIVPSGSPTPPSLCAP